MSSPATPNSSKPPRNMWKTVGLVVLGLFVLSLVLTYWVGFLLLLLAAVALGSAFTPQGMGRRPLLLGVGAILLVGSLWGFNSTRQQLRAEERARVAQQQREDAAAALERAAEERRAEAERERIDAELDAEDAAGASSGYTSRSTFETACMNLVRQHTDGEVTSARSTELDGAYAAGVQVDGGAEKYGCAMDAATDEIILINQSR
ncbi:hypothetical protein [Deinococcus sp. NW-56]|uniref:hypothetical protein n=1 Tax=Deinococcus sp. NW-56 TaxID=2080419 RepID=UPI001319E840|nr:hypothetical protein [Deinococcus sp. NW-56]